MKCFEREKTVRKTKYKRLQYNSNSSNIYAYFKLVHGNPWDVKK